MIERILMGASVAAFLAGLYITSGDQSEAETGLGARLLGATRH